jgi:nitroreductase
MERDAAFRYLPRPSLQGPAPLANKPDIAIGLNRQNSNRAIGKVDDTVNAKVPIGADDILMLHFDPRIFIGNCTSNKGEGIGLLVTVGQSASRLQDLGAEHHKLRYATIIMTIAPSTIPAPPQEMDALPAPQADKALLDMLALRRSIKVAHLAEPGPDAETLTTILQIGARVPDHGKLGPWRFVILSGEDRQAYGDQVAALLAKRMPKMDSERLAMESERFARTPVVVAVISTAAPHAKIPEWEQILSAGAVCHNIMLAARGFGFGSVWLSEWVAYDREALALLGMTAQEQLAGFIYMGTTIEAPVERPRPDALTRISKWSSTLAQG